MNIQSIISALFITILLANYESTYGNGIWNFADELEELLEQQQEMMKVFNKKMHKLSSTTKQLADNQILTVVEQDADVQITMHVENLQEKDISAQQYKDTLSISIHNDTVQGKLVITAPRSIHLELQEEVSSQQEKEKSFSQKQHVITQTLPVDILIPDEINIAYENDIITITVPKAVTGGSKKVNINFKKENAST